MDITRDGMQWRADLVGDGRALIDHAGHAFPLGELFWLWKSASLTCCNS